jgi:beta-fructofuranosidase
MLARDGHWVWDSWYTVDGEDLHAFYLMAPISLGDPELRHIHARVGHSVSRDGNSWTHLQDALGPSDDGGFDSQAIWTGSVVKSGDVWHMFYTGIGRADREWVQAIGHATSPDLVHWARVATDPTVTASPLYAQVATSADGIEHFRDPWVFAYGGTWHMLITATAHDGWGTIGHATSPNLHQWSVGSALVANSYLQQLEVVQVIDQDGEWVLLFSMRSDDVQRAGIPGDGGTYCAPADGPTGPFHLDRAEVVATDLYASRAVWFRNRWLLLGFAIDDQLGDFEGVICDAIDLEFTSRGTVHTVSTVQPG